MHYRRTYCILIALLMALCGKAAPGDTLSAAFVESHSYELYLAKDWKALSRFSAVAIRHHDDYYYLRMRAGIAAYELKQYRKAIRQFLKALDYNSLDETAMSYLYSSYVYAGQYEEARNLSRHMDSLQKKLTGATQLKPLAYVALEGAVKLSDSSARFQPASYIQANGQHYIRNRFSLFHALTYYGQDEFRQNIRQYQYYLAAAIPLRKRLMLSGGVHVFYDELGIRTVSTSTVLVQLPSPPGFPPRPPELSVQTHTSMTAKYTSGLAGALSLIKKTAYFDLSLGLTACAFDTANQYQAQAGLCYYPFGNRSLALGGLVYHHTENNYKNASLAYVPYVAVLAGPNCLLTASWLSNRGANVTENNAYLINNSLDLSWSRVCVSAEYRLWKHLSAYALYGYEARQEKYTGFKYHYHTGLLGLKFIP